MVLGSVAWLPQGGDLDLSLKLVTRLGGLLSSVGVGLLDHFRFDSLPDSQRKVKNKSMHMPRQANSKRGSNKCRL